MARTDLEKELRKEIDRDVDALVCEARDEGEALLKRTREECDRRLRLARSRHREELAMRRRKALSRAELEAKNLLRRARREEIDRLFAAARNQLERIEKESPEEFTDLLWDVYQGCREMIPGPRIRVRLGTGAAALRDRIKGEDGIEMESTGAFSGLMVESVDGHVHCDGSVDALLNDLRQEKEPELALILFDEEPDDGR